MTEKTQISMLQECMQKQGLELPTYVYMGCDNGLFKYMAKANGITKIGSGRTKQNARHRAAQLILESINGYKNDVNLISLHREFNNNIIEENHISRLQEYCSRMSAITPKYSVIGDSGPSHSKLFILECEVGPNKFIGEAKNKKMAKQIAAGKMLEYLSKNPITNINCPNYLEIVTKRNESALEKFIEIESQWNTPTKAHKFNICNYHFCITDCTSVDKRKDIKEMLESNLVREDPIVLVEKILDFMCLEFKWGTVKSKQNYAYNLEVPHVIPPICIIGIGETKPLAKMNTAIETLHHISILLSV